jgi:HSP20 family protein
MSNKLQLWSPVSDLWNLQDEVNRIFRDFGFRRRGEDEGELSVWAPAVDICEDKESVKLTVELPGMKREQVKLHVEDGVLTIKGERKFSEETKRENYHRIERSYGAFSRSFTLPSSVQQERITAAMRDGVLEVLIPKREEAKQKEIAIEVK